MRLPKVAKGFILATAAAFIPLAAHAGGPAPNIAGLDDGPAMSSYAETRMDQGFASHNSGASGQDRGDGSVSVVIEEADGNSKVVRMDPISGKILDPTAAKKK